MERKKLYPVNEEGFIDEGELYSLAYGELRLPYDSLWDISPDELYYIAKGHYESERRHFEFQTFSTFHAIQSVMSKGKFKNPFSIEKTKSKKVKVTQEQIDKEVQLLESVFDDN